jgi:hypothetical protein
MWWHELVIPAMWETFINNSPDQPGHKARPDLKNKLKQKRLVVWLK